MIGTGCMPDPLQYWPDNGSDPVTFVFNDPAPALVLYHDRATLAGWDAQKQAAWEPFLIDVMGKESGFCPNLRRGARIGDPVGCVLSRQGTHSDSGIGQVLMGYPNKRGWYRPAENGRWGLHENAVTLCPTTGICTPDETIATPEASMDILLAMVDHAGSGPWCYSKQARGYHKCRLAPDR